MGGKRERLWALVLAVIAAYAIRAIDWLAAQAPAAISALAAVLEWLSQQGSPVLEHPLLPAGGLFAVLFWAGTKRPVDSMLLAASRRLIEWTSRRLPSRDRDRWKEEWLGELPSLEDKSISSLAFAIQVGRLSRRLS